MISDDAELFLILTALCADESTSVVIARLRAATSSAFDAIDATDEQRASFMAAMERQYKVMMADENRPA